MTQPIDTSPAALCKLATHPSVMFTDEVVRRQISPLLLAIAAEKEAQQPAGILFQHGETGRTTFVAVGEEDHFEEHNHRWSRVGPLYLAPQHHPKQSSPDERYLRRLLALRVAFPCTYIDDGEASGSQHGITIDFMRDSVVDIDVKLRALNVARMKCSKAEQPLGMVDDGLPALADVPLPELSAEDRQLLHDNPNTDDVVQFVHQYAEAYAKAAVAAEREMREALELIAAPKRPDGTWNRDREACRQLAAEALGRYDEKQKWM